MKTVLICPSERPAVAFLAQTVPVVSVPLLGESLLNYWMQWLAEQRATEVMLLATDRPEQVRSIVGEGARWGTRVEVWPELHEPSLNDAVTKFFDGNTAAAADHVFVLDHCPGFP